MRCTVAFRFNYRVKLFPGVRLNFGKSGVSTTFGKRGLGVTAGERGTFLNVGAPGTGMSYRTRLDKKNASLRSKPPEYQNAEQAAQPHHQPQEVVHLQASIDLLDTGEVRVSNHATSEPFTPAQLKVLWQEKGDMLREWLAKQRDKIQGDMETILKFHEATPKPTGQSPTYDWQEFLTEKPVFHHKISLPREPTPPLKVPHDDFLSRFPRIQAWRIQRHKKKTNQFKKKHKAWDEKKERIEAKFAQQKKAYQKQKQAWTTAKKEHDAKQQILTDDFEHRLQTDSIFMSELFTAELESLDWPKETWVDFDIQFFRNKYKILLDVNLPEPSLLPNRTAEFSANKKRLKIKNKSQKLCREEYAIHIHGVLFRLTGMAFAMMPALDETLISGYTQVIDKKGHEQDTYLLSLKVKRDEWETLNFKNLARVKPIEALDEFKLRRKMTASFMFKSIKPWA